MYDILDNLIIKFGEEVWIDKLISGEIFMQPLKCYRDIEEKENKKGQGDKYEGILTTTLSDSYFYSKDNNKIIESINKITREAVNMRFEFKYSNDEKYLVACFYKIDKERFVLLHEENGCKYYNYKFTDDEKKVFGCWGDKALIINKFELISKILLNLDDFNIISQNIKYYNRNHVPLELLKDFQTQIIERLFWKDNYFKSQNEFRILSTEQSEKSKVITNIGNINEISMKCDICELLEKGFTYVIE